MSTIHDINTLAADALDEHGWTQYEMESNDGSMCLVGALRHCSPQPGDWLIAREVYRHLGHGEDWNDAKGRTAEEVTAWLRTHPVADTTLETAFGPQWRAIVTLIRQAATMTREQARALGSAWGTDNIRRWNTAADVVRKAAETTNRGNAEDAACDAASEAAANASTDAAKALSVADLVGQHGLTQNHIDTLLAPWISVMGDPRPGIVVVGGVVYTGEEGA